MTEPYMINVGGRAFTTLKSTLERSPFLKAMLSDQWTESTCYIDGMPFVDRSPLLFEHILDFLRSSVPPIFWTRTNGFDLPLYASLIHEAEYFQLETLATWIRNEEYINTILITSSIDLLEHSEKYDGKSHQGNIEQELEHGNVPGYQRLFLRKSRLRPPVSAQVLAFLYILAYTGDYRKFSNLINAHKALHGVHRMTEASFFLKVYLGLSTGTCGQVRLSAIEGRYFMRMEWPR